MRDPDRIEIIDITESSKRDEHLTTGEGIVAAAIIVVGAYLSVMIVVILFFILIAAILSVLGITQ